MVKYLIIIFLAIGFQLNGQVNHNSSSTKIPDSNFEVLQLLKQKCNACHKADSPEYVFTQENMETFARKINRQVFVWKRMPKGKEVKLTKSEKVILKEWIRSLK